VPNTLEDFANTPRWVIWRNEPRKEDPTKLTKVPYRLDGRKASSIEPETWVTRDKAAAGVASIVNGYGGGIGIVLGEVDDDITLTGIDLDTCRAEDGTFEPWAREILERFPTYTEISPSGKGAKLFFLVHQEDFDAISDQLNNKQTGRQFKKHGGDDHPPGFEIYFTGRYFTVTEQHLDGTPSTLTTIGKGALLWLLTEAGPALAAKPKGKRGNGHDNSRSAAAFRIGMQIWRAGQSYDDFCNAVRDSPETSQWYHDKGEPHDQRELKRIWEKAALAKDDWRYDLIVNKDGAAMALESNAMLVMRKHPDMVDVFALDEFHRRATLMRPPPWARPNDKFPRPVNDADLSDLLAWLQQQGIHLHGRGPVRIALASVVQDHTFHPIRDYLDSLIWDGTPRLDKWLSYYLGVEPIENYTALAGRWWMISAVARIYKSGCTAKYVLIIEGNQDLGKSTALLVLGGDWFTDDIETLGTKDSKLQVGNAWIIELAELDSTKRADISAIKAFISRRTDKFRPPYGEHTIEQHRQCALAATVNPPAGAYLHDETGAVRFWPVLATKIDLDALKHDRDQLWAEAVHRYKAGERWWPEKEDGFQPEAEQEARSETIEDDPWFSEIARYTKGDPAPFTASEVMREALDIPKERMDKMAQRRLGRILRKLGYVSKTMRRGDPVRLWSRAEPREKPSDPPNKAAHGHDWRRRQRNSSPDVTDADVTDEIQ
jgi:predicted P-loop ATPase